MSLSVICWLPTLASVESPMPKPMLPDPKLLRSLIANPARIAIRKKAETQRPIFELVMRRKKENIGFQRCRWEVARCFRGRAGVRQAAPLVRRQGILNDA